MQKEIVEAFPKMDMSLAVVWMDVLPLDGEKAARKTATILAKDPRIRHFFDPERRVGKAVAKTLGWSGFAWDIYLFYPKGAAWGETPPVPWRFAHQMGSHADDDHFHVGDDLERELRKTMGAAVAGP